MVQAWKRKYAPKFLILSVFKLPLYGFYRYEHFYTDRRWKCQKLKENNAVALDSCYIFTKKMLNTQLNLMLIVLMENPYVLDISEF